LRRNLEETTSPTKEENPEDRAKALARAKGATLGFSNNRLIDGSGAWSSEGALVYPISDKEVTWFARPAMLWRLEETEETTKEEIQELEFRVPIGREWDFSPKGAFSLLDVSLELYLSTDFSWSHKIAGVNFNAGYTGVIPYFPEPLNQVNKWIGLGSTQNGLVWEYRFIARPTLDYSDVLNSGPHTSRSEGDDWLRIGASTGMEFGLFGTNKSIVTFGVTYRFLETLNGDGGYSDYLRAYFSYGINRYTALTLEYQNGETPIASKNVDLIKLALEVKF